MKSVYITHWTQILFEYMDARDVMDINTNHISIFVLIWKFNGLDTMYLYWKDIDAGKDWRQEEKGTTEDEMVGWLHWLSGHEFE